MQTALRANISELTDAYVRATGLAASTVLARAAKDARFLERTAIGGGTFTVRVYEKALVWFSENWPADVDWPVGIERPAPAPSPVVAES